MTDTIRITVPVRLKRRGCRKLILFPEGHVPTTPRQDNTLIQALAKAWHWQRMLEHGRYASLEAFAEKQRINKSYAARILRLNLLAPDIRETILDGRQPKGLKLADLLPPFPAEWERQREKFGFVASEKE